MSTVTETKIENIKILNIFPSKTNPRKSFDKNGIEELAESIKQHGLLQPILVRYILDDFDKDGNCNYEMFTVNADTELQLLLGYRLLKQKYAI